MDALNANVGNGPEPAPNSHVVPSGQLLAEMRDGFDRLRGRMYELVECTGMPDEQAEAFKRLIRRQSHDVQSRLEGRLRGEGQL